MKITIEEIGREQDEEIILRCHKINDNIEKLSKDSKIEDLVRMLHSCDERSMKIIEATVKAA